MTRSDNQQVFSGSGRSPTRTLLATHFSRLWTRNPAAYAPDFCSSVCRRRSDAVTQHETKQALQARCLKAPYLQGSAYWPHANLAELARKIFLHRIIYKCFFGHQSALYLIQHSGTERKPESSRTRVRTSRNVANLLRTISSGRATKRIDIVVQWMFQLMRKPGGNWNYIVKQMGLLLRILT